MRAFRGRHRAFLLTSFSFTFIDIFTDSVVALAKRKQRGNRRSLGRSVWPNLPVVVFSFPPDVERTGQEQQERGAHTLV